MDKAIHTTDINNNIVTNKLGNMKVEHSKFQCYSIKPHNQDLLFVVRLHNFPTLPCLPNSLKREEVFGAV